MSSEGKLPQDKAITDKPIVSPWWKKMSWMIIIWLGSVFTLFAFSSVFRLLMNAAGMKVK